jgi:hypothetical protein
MILDVLHKIVTLPSKSEEKEHWFQQLGLSDLLQKIRADNDIVPIYASAMTDHGSIVLHGILVPSHDVQLRKQSVQSRNELVEWESSPYSGPTCGLVYSADWAEVQLNPARGFDLPIYRNADQLLFMRSFEEKNKGATYPELSQTLTIPHGLHWVEERRAWCRLDDCGDVEDVAKVEIRRVPNSHEDATVIWINRALLEQHMAATKKVMLINFDSTLHTSFESFSYQKEHVFYHDDNGLYMRYAISPTMSYFRGSQIISPRFNALEMGAAILAEQQSPKNYVSFITQDFKNCCITDVSCSPKSLASYFEPKSDLPFQTSPVFFKADVLDKYKADPVKYSISARSITCRNSWHLKSFDINDAGQVHTFIGDMGHLPFSEQLYWKSFNEAPRGQISKRSYENDFLGVYSSEIEPLDELKRILRAIDLQSLPWFRIHDTTLIDQIHYPLTTSLKTWTDVLITMAKCIVESLNKSYLERSAKNLSRAGDPKFGSIKWLGELLIGLEVDADQVSMLVDPFVQVQMLRSKLAAHAGGNEAEKIRKDLILKFKSPKKHIEELCVQLTSSLTAISELIAQFEESKTS